MPYRKLVGISVARAKTAAAAYKLGRLTASKIEGLQDGTYSDAAQVGLQLNVRGGTKTWLLRIEFQRRPTRLTLGHLPTMGLADAREEARRLRDMARQGIDPRRARNSRRTHPEAAKGEHPPKHTVGHLAAEFLERYVRPNRKRPEDAKWLLGRDILREWRERDARSITPREVIDLLDSIVDRGAPVLANRTARILGQMYRFGVQRRIVDSSPVVLLTPPGGREKARKRVLSDDELKAFLADPQACTRHEKLTHVIMTLLLTGVRPGELAQARWTEFDFQAKTWTVPDVNHKEDEGPIVPLTGTVLTHLQVLKALAGHSPWVFPAKRSPGKRAVPQELGRRLARCMERFKKQGIEKFTLQDLRRTCRTGLSRLGVAPHISERILSHRQPGVVGVYDRYQYLKEKREALEQWAAHVDGLKPKRG
jgi:integrase